MNRSAIPYQPVPALYFFGCHLEPFRARRVRTLTETLRKARRLSGAPVREDRLHMTFKRVGYDCEERMVQAACRAGDAVAAAPSFDVTFDSTMSFANEDHRPFVMLASTGETPLHGFLQTLDTALRIALPTIRLDRSVTPHVTLLYDKATVEQAPIEPITWTISDFSLIKSYQGLGIHKVIRNWSLARSVVTEAPAPPL